MAFHGRVECMPSNGPFLIFGDTLEAVLIAKRLLSRREYRESPRIYLCVEGNDLTGLEGITDTDWVPRHRLQMPAHFESERVSYVQDYRRDACVSESHSNPSVINYKYPVGVLGSYMFAPIVVRAGNWHQQPERLTDFLRRQTVDINPPRSSHIAGNRLAADSRLPVVSTPTDSSQLGVLIRQFPFLDRDTCRPRRNLGIDILNYVLSFQGVTLYTGCSDFKFEALQRNGSSPTYDISFLASSSCDGQRVRAQNAVFISATNPFTLSRIVAPSFPRFCTEVPAEYRAVISIPTSNPRSGVYINNSKHLGDLVTSLGSVSAGAQRSQCSKNQEWLIQYYTSVHDFFQGSSQSLSADYPPQSALPGRCFCTDPVDSEGNTLLIVSAVNRRNKRTVSYNISNRTAVVRMNDNRVELDFLRQFARIVSMIRSAYTGLAATNPDPPFVQNITGSGYIYEHTWITNKVQGLTPLVTYLEVVRAMTNATHDTSLCS